jgi:hypothetical protein
VEALTKGALPRAMRMGRTVPLDEHASTHVGAAQTVPALMERYRDDGRVSFDIIDNSRGRGAQELGSVETIRPLEYDRVREDLLSALEAERAAGRISEAVYRGTAGKAATDRAGNRFGDDRVSEAGNPTVDRVAAASPEAQQAALRAAVGQAVEGQPINVESILGEALPKDIQRLLVDTDLQSASRAADETLAREIEPTAEANLKAAEEEASLAETDAKALAERLGVKYEPDEALAEGLEKAERWARVAELATVCLVRGG